MIEVDAVGERAEEDASACVCGEGEIFGGGTGLTDEACQIAAIEGRNRSRGGMGGRSARQRPDLKICRSGSSAVSHSSASIETRQLICFGKVPAAPVVDVEAVKWQEVDPPRTDLKAAYL